MVATIEYVILVTRIENPLPTNLIVSTILFRSVLDSRKFIYLMSAGRFGELRCSDEIGAMRASLDIQFRGCNSVSECLITRQSFDDVFIVILHEYVHYQTTFERTRLPRN